MEDFEASWNFNVCSRSNNFINTVAGLKSVDPWVHVGDETFDTAFWVSLGDNADVPFSEKREQFIEQFNKKQCE